MRALPLWDSNGRLRPDAISELMVRTYFPEDDDSHTQALMLWQSERARAAAQGSRFRFSKVAHMVATRLEPRVVHMTLAGYVALVLMFMGQEGHPMHLKRAALIVSDFIGQVGNGRLRFRPMVGATSVRRSRKVSCDANDIERYFRNYRSVAHVLAAEIAVSEYINSDLHPGSDPDPDYMLNLVRTAMDFEVRLSAAPNFTTWNLWSVTDGAPADLWRWPPMLPSIRVIGPLLGEQHLKDLSGAGRAPTA